MRLTLTTAAAGLPVDLDDTKSVCSVSFNDHDAMISGLIAAATEMLDGPAGILGRAIITQTWLMELPQAAWPVSVKLPLDPVISVTVRYRDAAGELVVLDPSRVDLVRYPSQPVVLRFRGDGPMPAIGSGDWPVQMEIVAGFGENPGDVPAGIRTAINMIVRHWYDNRAAVSERAMQEVPMAASALLARWRIML